MKELRLTPIRYTANNEICYVQCPFESSHSDESDSENADHPCAFEASYGDRTPAHCAIQNRIGDE